MSEAIYEQVEDAIRRKLHVGVYTPNRFIGPWVWRYPDHIELGNIVMRDSDCGLAKPTMTWTTDEWEEHVKAGGLWKMVGFWDFVPADEPAADCIRFCHQSPDAAGRELYRLRQLAQEVAA